MDGMNAMSGLLVAMAEARKRDPTSNQLHPLLPVRIHYFFRSIRWAWACCDPECGAVAPKFQSDERRVGKLYFEPRIRCECGARVLDLLFCQTCGEAFLGGYKSQDPNDPDTTSKYLLFPDVPDLENLPDSTQSEKSAATYGVYWPDPTQKPGFSSWKKRTGAGEQYKFRFNGAVLKPSLAQISVDPANRTGWVYTVRADQEIIDAMPPLPIICPRCGDDREVRFERTLEGRNTLPVTSPKRTRSSLHWQGTGFAKINQVLADGLLRQMPSEEMRKLVLFSDSRQDAAKLAAGLEMNHYLDVIRQLAVEIVSEENNNDAELYERLSKGEPLTSEEQERATAYMPKYPHDAIAIQRTVLGNATPKQLKQAEEAKERANAPIPWSGVRDELELRLTNLGINPAGIEIEMQSFKDTGTRKDWDELYFLGTDPPQRRQPGTLSSDERQHLDKIRTRLLGTMQKVVMANMLGDFESLGFGVSTLNPRFKIEHHCQGIDPQLISQVCDATIRILGSRSRYKDGQGQKRSSPQPPGYLKRYWKEVAKHRGIPNDTLELVVCQILEESRAIEGFLHRFGLPESCA
jgi:hypothetical protein